MSRNSLRLSPPLALILSFAAAILIGTAALSTPLAANGARIAPIDALFTATSAICVTGLAVVQVGARLSPFGQLVVLLLIQAGGLGIMTFAVLVILALGRRVSLRGRLAVQDALHHTPNAGIKDLVRHVVRFALTVEGIGALLLFLRWRAELGDARAAWAAAFHAVSAFCNAGFSLFPDSLARFRGDVLVNLVVTGLIIVGGLGFLVTQELRFELLRALRMRRRPVLSLHTRLTLAVTGGLLGLGMLGFLAFERHNLLAGLSSPQSLLAAWFQAVTPRTAGFNTLDYGRATAATLCLTLFLMFVGASPGSTGGGVKTTTLGVLLGLVRARWRGRSAVLMLGRTVPKEVVERAVALVLLSGVLVLGAATVLVFSEQGLVPYYQARPAFLALLFEAVSAFGTVGLSTGITPGLSPVGKLTLMLLMFVGRVGALNVAIASSRPHPARYRYAEESAMVG
jgi:trk/ktr system potassium uptake protein